MKEKSNSFRNRLSNIFDGLISSAIFLGLTTIIPTAVAFFLNLEIQLIFLIALFTIQVVSLILLFRIQNQSLKTKKEKRSLIKNEETNEIYFVDDFELPHLIKDEFTKQYFIKILGYNENEIPKFGSGRFKPSGENITPIRDFRLPRTIEDERNAEARNSFKLVAKKLNLENSQKEISFTFRFDDEYMLEVNSAKIFFGLDSPVAVGDIAYNNEPKNEGLQTCYLLFDGTEKRKKIIPKSLYRADLFLSEDVSNNEAEKIYNARLGYIEIKAIYREVSVYFHIDI